MTSRSQGTGGGAAVHHSRKEIATAIQLQGLKPLEVPAAISISDLANIMDIGGVEIIKELMRSGYIYNINEVIEHDIATVVAQVFGFGVLPLAEPDTGPASLVISTDEEDEEKLQPRPPVSPSWDTWTMARPRCWTRSGTPR